jgi:L-2-hydroxyglutarate oxidase LhgO
MKNNTPKPTPAPPAAIATPAVPASPAAPDTGVITPPGTDAGTIAGENAITGFAEGETVKETELNEKVRTAIKQAYKDAKIKTITFATYLNDQVYHVVLDGTTAGNTEQFYVKADGTIVPYEANTDAPKSVQAP